MRSAVSSQGWGAARDHRSLGQGASLAEDRFAAADAGTGTTLIWARNFLYAGASALLLLVADLFPAYWYLSFIALTPFLYRISRADRAEALRLGFLLGLTFFGVRIADSTLIAPLRAIVLMATGVGMFTLLAWTISRARESWGFNPVVVSLLWVAFELVLTRTGVIQGMFSELELGAGFLYKTAVLFGFLAVSFVIVLFNSILIAAVDAVVSLARARGQVVTEGEGIWDLLSPPGLVAQRFCLAGEGRGPPGLKVGLSNFHADTNSIPLAAGE